MNDIYFTFYNSYNMTGATSVVFDIMYACIYSLSHSS